MAEGTAFVLEHFGLKLLHLEELLALAALFQTDVDLCIFVVSDGVAFADSGEVFPVDLDKEVNLVLGERGEDFLVEYDGDVLIGGHL